MDVKLKKFSLLEPNVKVKAIINIDTPIPIQEKSGILPLEFNTVSNELIDWTITGTAGGVGKLGKNYLKQKTTPIPNGCEGTYLASAFSYRDAFTGYTFNSGNATRIYITFKRTNDANIVAGDTGDLMLVEGSTIPETYDADTNLYKHGLLQGSSEWHDPASGEQGKSQLIYCSENEYGSTSEYNSSARNIRCKTYPIMLKPNTTYSVRLFNSSYSEVQFAGALMTEPGTITPQFQTLVNQKSIPGNETFVANTEQWTKLAYSHYKPIDVPIDVRPIRYEFCESFAELKAGTYKLMIDEWGNYDMGSDWIGFSPYSGCYEDNWDGQQTGIYEWFALVKEDNSPIISKTRLFDASMDSYENRRSKTSPFPNYFHKEFTFTLTEDTKVGLMHKAYYHSSVYTYPPYFRFYIVDSDVEAESFTTTGCSPVNMSGYSAWEKYNVSLPINIYCEGQTQTVTFDLGESFLSEEDSISFADSQITIPTYVGTNTISADSTIQPEMYIKYRRF